MVSEKFLLGTWWNHSIVKAPAQISAVSGIIIEQKVKFLGKEEAQQIEKRIDAIINDKRKIEVVDMMDIQNDITSPFAKEINETILFLIKDEETEKFQKTVDLLKGYNGVEAAGSQATLAFHTLYLRSLENIFSDELEKIDKEAMNTLLDLKSITSFAIRKALSKNGSVWTDNVNTPNKDTIQDILILS